MIGEGEGCVPSSLGGSRILGAARKRGSAKIGDPFPGAPIKRIIECWGSYWWARID